MHPNVRNAVTAIIYFAVSVLITAWFIEQKFGYVATPVAILLSNIIAGFKWAVMVIAAIVLLEDKRWIFIRRMGFACLLGNCAMLSVFVFRYTPVNSWDQFKYSLCLAILVMLLLYFKAVIDTGLSMKWFALWLICFAIGIALQTRVVFSLHPGLVKNEVSHFFDSRKKLKYPHLPFS